MEKEEVSNLRDAAGQASQQAKGEGAAPIKAPVLKWRPLIVAFYNANESPLWELSPRELNAIEEYLDEPYYEALAYLCGAETVVIIAQSDGPTGLLAFDEMGEIINLPELRAEDFQSDIQELEERLGHGALDCEIATYLQKKYGKRKLAAIVHSKSQEL
jgi:hypothetical protein